MVKVGCYLVSTSQAERGVLRSTVVSVSTVKQPCSQEEDTSSKAQCKLCQPVTLVAGAVANSRLQRVRLACEPNCRTTVGSARKQENMQAGRLIPSGPRGASCARTIPGKLSETVHGMRFAEASESEPSLRSDKKTGCFCGVRIFCTVQFSWIRPVRSLTLGFGNGTD